MGSRTRRDFLKLSAASTLIFAHGADAGDRIAQPAYRKPGSLDRYVDVLRIPRRLLPYGTRVDRTLYRVRMFEFTQQMHSQLPPTKLWGYEGQYPGPIIEAQRGKPIEILWENHLPSDHIFAVDPRIHGAMPPAPSVRTVPHLHGSRTRSESDGLPEKWFPPGSSARYQYPNDQEAATLWYHDHAVGITRLNVYAGLSGFFLLRDAEEHNMQLPSGDYEIPLILQDRTLNDQGQLVYCPTYEDGQSLPPGVWGPEFFGQLPVVNGCIYPYLEVEPCWYRLRVLNGANSRFFSLYLNLAKHATDIPSLVPFHQIGTDGGFLPSPAPLSKLLIGPAERADLIVDFSGLEGKTVTLSNDAHSPFPGWKMQMTPHARLCELMEFRVTLPLSSKGKSFSMPPSRPLPDWRRAHPSPPAGISSSQRNWIAGDDPWECASTDKGYDDPVTEFVKLGSLEKWRFINTTDDAHPMHLHLVQFQILHRQGFNRRGYEQGKLADSWAHHAHLRQRSRMEGYGGRQPSEMCSPFWFGSRATPAAMSSIATCWNTKITT